MARDMISALALCHNVTPTYENDNQEEVEYQASSPDEVALVKFAKSLDMQLVKRDQVLITIQNALGQHEEYYILANFPFSSETKRMGIVLRHKAT